MSFGIASRDVHYLTGKDSARAPDFQKPIKSYTTFAASGKNPKSSVAQIRSITRASATKEVSKPKIIGGKLVNTERVGSPGRQLTTYRMLCADPLEKDSSTSQKDKILVLNRKPAYQPRRPSQPFAKVTDKPVERNRIKKEVGSSNEKEQEAAAVRFIKEAGQGLVRVAGAPGLEKAELAVKVGHTRYDEDASAHETRYARAAAVAARAANDGGNLEYLFGGDRGGV